MANRTCRWSHLPSFSLVCAAGLSCFGSSVLTGQVFVVGERSAMAGISTEFTPTRIPLPDGHISERGRRELIRNLEAEQGFAHRVLPMGAGLTLEANGPLTPGPDQYKQMIYEKGQSSAPGDRVVVTALTIKGDRITVDFNGGPFAKHRFLSHISLNDSPVANPGQPATGSRVTLVFPHGIPEISAPEVKALLTPVIDFGAKTSSDAFADTLPGPLKDAIAAHDVLVGMDRRMVLASLGSPESKVREQNSEALTASTEAGTKRYEEWIYGHVPQTVKFVRFTGDRVVLVKIAALGKPIEIHNQDEMGDFALPGATREIALGDTRSNPDHPAAPPTLREPGEVVPVDTTNKVQFPVPKKPGVSGPQLQASVPPAR